jgi:hypothetical protein
MAITVQQIHPKAYSRRTLGVCLEQKADSSR